MAQADYVISPNPTGLAMRTEVNQIFQAILTSNAGATEPSVKQAGMLWGDMSNSSTFYLKIRNHTNDGWASLYAYDVATKTIQPMSNGSTLASLFALKANLSSPTFTGTITADNINITDLSFDLGSLSTSQILQLRRGTTAQHSTFTGAVGELTIDTDKKTVIVHDGATAGGKEIVSTSGNQTIAGTKTFSNTISGSISGSSASCSGNSATATSATYASYASSIPAANATTFGGFKVSFDGTTLTLSNE
jgi:hypothetical protein